MAFALKIDADKFSELDEAHKGFYVEKEGSYQLDVTGLPEVEDVSGLKHKIDELLTEKKAIAKAKADEQAEANRKLKEQAEKDNNHEALYKSSELEREKLQDEHNLLLQSIATEKVNTASQRIASQMADKDNADLLSTFIKPRIGFVDGEQKILDSSGQPTVSTEADLIKEFTESGRYNALLRGNQSGGGGADADNNGGGATGKTATRTEFDAMGNLERSQFSKSGGKVTDD